jgi:predicted esterase
MFWVVGANGWGASGETFIIEPGQVKTFKADLRATYPDKTPKLNPAKLKQIRWMISKPKAGQAIQILSLNTQGSVDPWVQPKVMLDLPEMTSGSPGPGKRVKVQLQEDKNNFKYFALYLPTNWQPNKSYPVIFEYPGNIFYSTKACYSSGRPESCTMGYGISQGKDSIWVSMPFIDQDSQTIAENGFGSNEGKDTINYSLKVIDLVCQQWNGDRNNLFICGFSRGSIACGYIGLSNDKIAAHWKGIIGCQHYDGSRWNQSNMKGAILRAPRFKGKAIFQVDNQKEKYQPVVDATSSKVGWTFTKSGLNYHSTTMFLDDRPMMQQLRRWYYSIRQ